LASIFFRDGRDVRNPSEANLVYPCEFGLPHICGQVLGAFWWGVRERIGIDAARAETLIEVLEADDLDGDLLNGTPHMIQICAASAKRGGRRMFLQAKGT